MKNKQLCDNCTKQPECKYWDNIKSQPKLTIVGCEHFAKEKAGKNK